MTGIANCAQQLTKKYADRTVVDRLGLTVPSGTVLSLLGPNGAGKAKGGTAGFPLAHT